MRHLFLVLLFFSCTAVVLGLFGIGRRQSISVQGHLTCNGRPASGVKVKLYDKGVGKFCYMPYSRVKLFCRSQYADIPVFDSKLGQSYSDAFGRFWLSGSKSEITRIDPKVNIYHKCNYRGVSWSDLGQFSRSNTTNRHDKNDQTRLGNRKTSF